MPRVLDTRFVLDGRQYDYLWHPADETWRSERSVEIPIGLSELAKADPRRTLEVGNVLRKYARPPSAHEVIDKYEHSAGVVNADALTFSGGPYDLIVSISTLEHVGYDEEPREAGKAARAIENLRGLLSPGGEMLATIPIGYNRDLDDALRDGSLGARVSYLARVGGLRWKQVGARDTREIHGWPWPGTAAVYGWPWPGANVLAVGRWASQPGQQMPENVTVSGTIRHHAEPGLSRSLPRGSKRPQRGCWSSPGVSRAPLLTGFRRAAKPAKRFEK